MKITYIDEPNMIVPLAASFNQRGIKGYTQAVVNEDDQIKINSVYEPYTNALSQKTTLYLAKRPGVVEQGGNTYGSSTNIAYLHEPGPDENTHIVFYLHGTDIRAANASVSTNVTTGAVGYAPAFVDTTFISGHDHIVVQLRNASGTQTKWHTSSIANGFTQFGNNVPASPIGKMEFLDGYAFLAGIENDTDGAVFNSDLNSLASWPVTNWIARRSKQDTQTGLAKLGSQIISFGLGSFEVYRNAGTSFGSPLEAVQDLFQNYGLPSTNVIGMRHYCATIASRLYWRGANPHGVFAYNGQTVEKVSNLAVDKILAERQHYFVGRIGFAGQVALVIGLSLVTDANQVALLFFPAWKDWFVWESTVFIPQTSSRNETLCLGLQPNQHKLYLMATSTEIFQDAGTNYTWTHQFKLPKRGNGFQRMDMFGLVGDTASSSLNISSQFSFDDWGSLTAGRVIDMMSHKKAIYRCGAVRSPVGVKLSYTGDQPVRLESAMARIS
jgi:hypothetical protein